jgi:uncharacterized protein (DUF342 family)
MEAVALTKPGQLVAAGDIELAVKTSGVCYGLDVLALRRLCDGPAASTGRQVIARGRQLKLGRPAGFVLCGEVAAVSIDQLAETQQLARVQAGATLGLWCESERGRSGMDVFGHHCPAPGHPVRQPTDCIGDGVELSRDALGRIAVRATRPGLCQRQADGAVRVVGAVEIAGDFGPDQAPIDTTDLVVVRGNVLAGATISSTSDIVILGDLANAAIRAGGNLEVDGAITAGDQPIDIAG